MDAATSDAAIKALDGAALGGRNLKVKEARPRRKGSNLVTLPMASAAAHVLGSTIRTISSVNSDGQAYHCVSLPTRR